MVNGIGFDSRSQFSWTDGSWGKNGTDMNSSMHVDNKKKNILVLGEESTQGLYNTTITVEDKYPIHLTESGKRFVLSLHYNGSNSFLFVNAVKMCQFKAKDLEIKPHPLCLGNI